MGTVAKLINQSQDKMMLYQNEWLVEKTVEFKELLIRECSTVRAPEGKQVTLIVNGVVRDITPGKYMGKVVLYVSDFYITTPMGLMTFNNIACTETPAICVEHGKVSSQKSVSAAVWKGNVTDTEADGVYIVAGAESFNGVVIDNSDYTVKNSRIDLEGYGSNDMNGVGTAVSVYGDSKATVVGCDFNVNGITRPAIHVGGHSHVSIIDCDVTNLGPESKWIGRFCWQLPLRGSNRLTQLSDFSRAEYIGCRMKTNGWGIFSLDGCDDVKLLAKDCKLVVSGPGSHGYGAFCMGPNEVMFDNCYVDVSGMVFIIMGMEGKGRWSVLNGSVFKSLCFGVVFNSDDNSIFTAKDSAFDSVRANIVLKSSVPRIDLDNCDMRSDEGVLLQMMDSEESGMDQIKYFVPVGIEDVRIEGRDLTDVSEKDNAVLNLSNMSVEGDIFNSSTNIKAFRRSLKNGQGRWHDTLIGPVPYSSPAGEIFEMDHDSEFMHGPHNLGVNLKNASVTGVISSAVQAYPEGVTEITPENWHDISNITQTASSTVNNGVVVTLDSKSVWKVTGTSYITALTAEQDARIEAIDGHRIVMTVNGAETPLLPGKYTGNIVLSVS